MLCWPATPNGSTVSTSTSTKPNPAERQALGELRAGNVERAVVWYLTNGRLHPSPTPDQAIHAAVTGWAADVAAGADTVLLAWRRADVAELNRRARDAYRSLGGFSGPEVEAPGAASYAAGDRVVFLGPGPSGAWVTSERATIIAVHPAAGSIDAVTAEGRRLRLDRDHTGPDQLAHAYAMTAHRTQGATVDTAHVLDGGGRELAYVAMSRARYASHVYVASDDLEEVSDRLGWSWTTERRVHWAHDQGTLQPESERHEPPDTIRHQAEEVKVPQEDPPERWDMERVSAVLLDTTQDRFALMEARGHWVETPVGEAARSRVRLQTALSPSKRPIGSR
ncbi:MAG: hypothetical protein NVS3B12_09420 [Acidimicrobiales bacterium]